MTKLAKVSVVIPCFNHGEFLPEAVASVTSMNRHDVELIVVNDGSTDDRSRKEIDALSANGIHVIHQQNKGLAAARNVGIGASHGKYILPLDADNRIRADYVEHGVRILDSNPKVGVVYGDGEFFGIRSGRWDIGPFDPNRLLSSNFIDACAVYRRLIWEQNCGYDSTMPVQGLEDWDFWLGALEHGWEFHYVREILFDYRVARDSMITRAQAYRDDTERFLATKHGLLYRNEFLKVISERELEANSGRAALRNLRRIVKTRLRQKFLGNGNHAQS